MFLDRLRKLLGGWSKSRRLRIQRSALRSDFLRRVPFRIESLEDRRVMASISWDGGAGTLNWGDANNWTGDLVPGPADDVFIDIAGTNTIAYGINSTVLSVNSNEQVQFNAGTLTVTAESAFNDGIVVSGGKWDPLESTCRHASLSIL